MSHRIIDSNTNHSTIHYQLIEIIRSWNQDLYRALELPEKELFNDQILSIRDVCINKTFPLLNIQNNVSTPIINVITMPEVKNRLPCINSHTSLFNNTILNDEDDFVPYISDKEQVKCSEYFKEVHLASNERFRNVCAIAKDKLGKSNEVKKLLAIFLQIEQDTVDYLFAKDLDDDADADEDTDAFTNCICAKCGMINCSLHFPTKNIQQPLYNLKEKQELYQLPPKSNFNPCSDSCALGSEAPVNFECSDIIADQCFQLLQIFLKESNPWCSISKCLDLKCNEIFSIIDNKKWLKSSTEKVNSIARTAKSNFTQKRFVAGVCESTRTVIKCDHDGLCITANCICFTKNMLCSSQCNCKKDCSIRFPGCTCKNGGCKTMTCACRIASRECDPTVCKTCDASIHPSLIGSKRRCCNVSILYKMWKKVYIAPSNIHGVGCFLGEDANKDDLIEEYTGEIISQATANKRGEIYDAVNRSFLFEVNNEYCVDSFRKGTKIKFANHSKKPNCYALVKQVNGEHKIGIYAARKILTAEELLLDYCHDNVMGARVPDFY